MISDEQYRLHKREQYKLWCARNPEKIKAYEKKRRPRDFMKEPVPQTSDRMEEESLEQYYARKRREYYFRNRRQRMLYMAKTRAKKSGIPFNITLEDIAVPEYCPALGLKLEYATGTSKPNSPTVDRIVPELGYVRGNVQVISRLANVMKSNATRDQLLNFAKWIIADEF